MEREVNPNRLLERFIRNMLSKVGHRPFVKIGLICFALEVIYYFGKTMGEVFYYLSH